MSLRNKLILLFVGLAVFPLLLLAAFSYWHAQNLLQSTVQAQLQESAAAWSRSLESGVAHVQEELSAFAVGDPDPGQPDGSLLEGNPEAEKGSLLASAAFLRFLEPSGRVRFLAGSVPRDPVRCSEGTGSRLVEFSFETVLGNARGTLTAGIWASELFEHEAIVDVHSVHLLEPATREILFSADCSLLQGGFASERAWGLASASLKDQEAGTFRFKEAGDPWLGAFERVQGTDWRVVKISQPIPVASSLNRMVLAYWLFVLGLAFTTMAAFSMLLGKFTKSLQELARAAEEIGTGELDPWLPLPTSGEVGQLTLAFSRMLARIRQMMAKVDQSGRLAVVGQLSAYLAHEIRNPLSSIKLNLQRLQRWTRNGSIPEFCLEPVEISLKEVERLSASVTGVLELSSSPDSPLEVVGLHALVEEAADLLAARFRRQQVVLTLDLDASADRVLARIGQIKSVVLNLMVNALEAQPNGGRLDIRSELTRISEGGGPGIALHFRDLGGGIPSEIRDRVFEPFFTTKAGGSGIGLAMANQAVQDCFGDLYLEPSISPGLGAEFVVVLPLASVEAGASTEPDLGLDEWPGVPPHWRRRQGEGEKEIRSGSMPPHLMSPEGLKAILSLSNRDPEDVN